MTARTFSATEVPALCDRLAALDPDLGRVVETFGYPPFWDRPNTFESLVWFILEQQVSLASAKAALDQLRQRVGVVTADRVLALSDEELRAAYFSRQKAGYVRGLAHRVVAGDLELESLVALPDSTIRQRLVRSKGIGNWTADVYLILVLHRLDLFPTGDLAAVNGLKALKNLPRDTTIATVAAEARSWAPYRTIGTMLVWHYYLSRKKPRRAG